MSLVAVDLAAKFSAACWMGDQHQVLAQWDSWQVRETTFIDFLVSPWAEGAMPLPHVLLIEDLPHRLSFIGPVKNVCRLQGRIVERMASFGFEREVVFVPPAEWRKYYPALRKRGSGPNEVVPVAKTFGNYDPPDLTYRFRGDRGEKAVARKVQTDYCAAYLIGFWGTSCWYNYGTFDVPGTHRYGQPVVPASKERTSGKG